jgi:DNA-directed RNA polymerase specialized sigma24 family protein
LAVLSSNRLRFADRLQCWGSFRLRSTGKTSQPSAGGRCCRRQNRQKCGRFIPALTVLRPRYAQIVELRYLAGLTIDETAELLNVSHATVEREWGFARAWLRRELQTASGGSV